MNGSVSEPPWGKCKQKDNIKRTELEGGTGPKD